MSKLEERTVLLIELNNGDFLDSKIVRVEQSKSCGEYHSIQLFLDTTLRFVCGREALGRRVRLTVSVYNVDHVFGELKSLSDLDDAFDLKCDKFGSFKLVFSIISSRGEHLIQI